jgi:hypothetical protein
MFSVLRLRGMRGQGKHSRRPRASSWVAGGAAILRGMGDIGPMERGMRELKDSLSGERDE